jgi:hypothetical protein
MNKIPVPKGTIDKFSAVLAVILLISIAYLSITEKIVETETLVYEPYEVIVTDTLTVSEIDTLWKFHTWQDDILGNEDSLIVSMSFLRLDIHSFCLIGRECSLYRGQRRGILKPRLVNGARKDS